MLWFRFSKDPTFGIEEQKEEYRQNHNEEMDESEVANVCEDCFIKIMDECHGKEYVNLSLENESFKNKSPTKK